MNVRSLSIEGRSVLISVIFQSTGANTEWKGAV
jgi:hypothetical protein